MPVPRLDAIRAINLHHPRRTVEHMGVEVPIRLSASALLVAGDADTARHVVVVDRGHAWGAVAPYKGAESLRRETLVGGEEVEKRGEGHPTVGLAVA